jgi:hypothetical protein
MFQATRFSESGVGKYLLCPSAFGVHYVHGLACPRPKEARRTRVDADVIVDKRMTQTAQRGLSTRLRVSTVKDCNCKVHQQLTQFERLANKQQQTNKQTIEEQSPFRLVNAPTHSCCTMPRFIGAPAGAGYLLAMQPAWGRNQVNTRKRARAKPGTPSAKQQGNANNH